MLIQNLLLWCLAMGAYDAEPGLGSPSNTEFTVIAPLVKRTITRDYESHIPSSNLGGSTQWKVGQRWQARC